MENKKSKTGLHVFVGILLGIIICGGVVFATYSLGYLTFNQVEETEKTETNNEENNETEEDISDNSLDFDTSKIVNSNGNADTYTLANYGHTINISLDETRKVVTLSYNRKVLSDTYTLNWDLTGVEDYVYENKQLTFEKEIKDIYFGGIGQDATGDIILFLMSDGTVEYIPVYQALLSNGIEGLTSYGVLPNITDVVKFYTVNASTGMIGSVSILAQTKDGTLYDLAPIINDASNNQ